MMLALAAAPTLWAQPEEGETSTIKKGVQNGADARAGLTFTWGPGYSETDLSAGASLQMGDRSPYLALDLSSNTYTRQASFGLGLWKDLDGDRSVKGEIGLSSARLEGGSENSAGAYVDGALEQALDAVGLYDAAVGAEYRLASGSVALSRFAREGSLKSASRGGGRTSAVLTSIQTGLSYELAVYAGSPLFGPLSASARLSLDFSAGYDSVTNEQAGLAVHVTGPLYMNGSITFAQGGVNGTFYALGAALHF